MQRVHQRCRGARCTGHYYGYSCAALWLSYVCHTSHRTLRSVARGAVSRAAVVAYVVLSAPFLVPSQWGAPGCLTWDSFELDGLP